jgi:hypothetical protein
MGKNTELKLVGQPIMGQILKLIDREGFKRLVREHNSDYYYKAFKSWTHLATMLFGILSRCDSMAETCEGLKGLSGKLQHLGLDTSPSKSTAGDGLRNRDSKFFEALYFELVKRYRQDLSVSRTLGLTIKELYIIDSTTIGLFSDILKGAGRNPKNDGRKKGGLKVHMLVDAVQGVGRFVRITEARAHDRTFLADIAVPAYSMLVFDKAYTDYGQFEKWTGENIFFVIRQKENAVFTVKETCFNTDVKKKGVGVDKEQLIEVSHRQGRQVHRQDLRRICYHDDKGRDFTFLSNNMNLSAEEIALIYKKRWEIEVLFKKMKQNFQLHYFYGESENAIKTQVWCTLIAQLLLTVTQRKAGTKKAFSTIAAIIRIHLTGMMDLMELLRKIKRAYMKKKTARINMPSLFAT